MADRGETDDLASLAKLDEATLLEELKRRYTKDKIYTYLGDVLVAVNPFKQLPIYETEQRKCYHNVSRTQNPPHIFAVASTAYRQMVATGNNQCCVISGESGAGKTESAKLIVTQLIELSQGRSVLEQKILQVNPLLEAFGNAATVMNNNSSRFGKYLQLKFKDGRVTGAKINEYLLEKSRVVYQNRLEQNFHVFYCMFAGLDASRKAQLGMENPDDFNYLCEETSCLLTRHREMQQQFEELQNALDLVGFESDFQDEIFACLAAVLHLGNVQFTEDDKECSHIVDSNSGPLKTVARLVGVDQEHLGALMTINVKVARGETIRKHLNQQKAAAARDALAKAVYDRIFRWIVNRINQLLAPTIEEMEDETEIGILDIFGFEKFEANSFEQLCINLANEQLQFFFNEHIFAMEKEEYKQEGLRVTDFKYQDNKPLLDLFLGKPLGLLSLLDEQSSFPQATDASLVTKFNDAFKKKKTIFIASKGSASGTFAIQHYAGKVVYKSHGFLEKNRDSLPDGAVELMRTSGVGLAQLIFLATISRTGTLAVGRLANRRTGRLKKRTIGKKGPVPAAKTVTVGAQFKNSLQVLIEKLNRATPHFIRCIKPNTAKVPNKFDDDYVITQLQYTGMLETIRIRREGYAFRPTFEDFVERYRTIAAEPQMTVSIANCRKILQVAKLGDFQIGKSKVFLKYWHVDKLNKQMEEIHQAVIVIQKVVRGFVQCCKYGVLLAAKRDQVHKLTDFLVDASRGGNEIFSQQQTLVAEDEKRARESPLALTTLMTSSMAAGAEVEDSSQEESTMKIAELAPPDDMLSPPPEPKITDIDDDDNDDVVYDDIPETDEGDSFIAPSRDAQFKKFGREGTKKASVRWFRETQVDRVRNSRGFFHEWFHGIITRRQAKQLLTDKTVGTFLIRVSESRFGYSLSFRVVSRCKHFMISQLETGKYVIVGEAKAHGSLEDMVAFHMKHPVNPEGDLLTVPCGQPYPHQPNFTDLLDSRAQCSVMIRPATIATGPLPIGDSTVSSTNRQQQSLQSCDSSQKMARPLSSSAGRVVADLPTSSNGPSPLPPAHHQLSLMAPPLPPRKH